MHKLINQIGQEIIGLCDETRILERESSNEEIMILPEGRREYFEDCALKLKISLYDYYATRTWIYDTIDSPEIPEDFLGKVNVSDIECLMRLFVIRDRISLDHDASLELVHYLIDPPLRRGIIHFLPLMKPGKSGKLGGGLDPDNHGYGYHFHYCNGNDSSTRTTLLFSNERTAGNWILFHEQHGSYQSQQYDPLSKKKKKAIWDCNATYKKRYSSWLKPSTQAIHITSRP